MKIIGIGVDILYNERIKRLLKNKKFLIRIFGKKEILEGKKRKNKVTFYSKRFAAKESLVKSLGTGFRKNINFKDIQILNDKLGKPYYLLSKKVKNFIKRKNKVKNFDLFLSISDEKEYSVAFTIIWSKK